MRRLTPELTQMAAGIAGAEGPCFDQAGQFFCVASDDGTVVKLNSQQPFVSVHVSTCGIPAGLQLARDGRIWIADMKRGILATNPTRTGSLAEIVTTFDNKPIRGCNDLCFDATGNCYFTAPAGSWEDPVGEVFSRAVDGTVQQIDRGYHFSNGIAVTPDSSRLIVAETRTKRLWSYALDGKGGVTGVKVPWGKLSGEHELGGPDGIDFTPDGKLLLACNWGGQTIDVFDAESGELVALLGMPFDRPSNLHFAPDAKSVWITEHTHMSVWKANWPIPGL